MCKFNIEFAQEKFAKKHFGDFFSWGFFLGGLRQP